MTDTLLYIIGMTAARWTDISHCIADHYEDYDGFVVLHGTDTMAYTASALSYMLENLTKPVIFTGSQLPIGQLRTDGKENLITAVEIAAAKDAEGRALVPEVGIYFGGHLLAATAPRSRAPRSSTPSSRSTTPTSSMPASTSPTTASAYSSPTGPSR